MKMNWLWIGVSLVLMAGGVMAAEEINYEEAKVPAYTLPALLTAADGTGADVPIRHVVIQNWFTELREKMGGGGS